MRCPRATQPLALVSVTLTKGLWTRMVTFDRLAVTAKEFRGENLQDCAFETWYCYFSLKMCDPVTDLDEKLRPWF